MYAQPIYALVVNIVILFFLSSSFIVKNNSFLCPVFLFSFYLMLKTQTNKMSNIKDNMCPFMKVFENLYYMLYEESSFIFYLFNDTLVIIFEIPNAIITIKILHNHVCV